LIRPALKMPGRFCGMTPGVAIACCVSGRLAYYKAEQEQYILEHLPTAA